MWGEDLLGLSVLGHVIHGCGRNVEKLLNIAHQILRIDPGFESFWVMPIFLHLETWEDFDIEIRVSLKGEKFFLKFKHFLKIHLKIIMLLIQIKISILF